MTLRARLTAAFLTVVLGPVLLGAVFVGYTVALVGDDRAAYQLEMAVNAARSEVTALCQQLRTAAELTAAQPPEQHQAVAESLVGEGPITAVRVDGVDAFPVAIAGRVPLQPWAECDAPGTLDTAARYRGIAASARFTTPLQAGEVWVVARLDQALVKRLATAADAAVTIYDAGPTGVLSTDEAVDRSLAIAAGLSPGQTGTGGDGRLVRRLEPATGQPLPLVITTRPAPPAHFHPLLSVVIALAGLLAVVVAWRLGRATTRPLAELAAAADRVADGDLSTRVPVRTADEAGQLAATFNRMTHRMQRYVQALTTTRDQLRRHLAVLGDTLSGTHDLDRILRVILQTALTATGAGGGAVLLVDGQARMLAGQAAGGPRGEDPEPGTEPGTHPLTAPLGEGLLGQVAAAGVPQRGRRDSADPPLPGAAPGTRTYLVVPITVPGGVAMPAAPWPVPSGVRGVLAVYDRVGEDEFDEVDQRTLETFAGQAGVAVDNVRIHEDAQRLSLTDPLTGLWNYRYLTESIRREVERASRFGHSLAVLVLDLDRFKDVNDAYGHPAGDAVLVEFARRVRAVIREVDLAFRHGGEEFAVMLPETDARGATVLAQRLGAAVRDPMVIASRSSADQGPTTDLPIQVTVSIGVAVYPDHALAPASLLEAADDALYAAKAAGRDTYRVASPPTSESDPGEPAYEPAAGGEPDRPPAGGAQPPRQSRGR